jgi:4-hydroxy-2-oxoheptanedioate aldolase
MSAHALLSAFRAGKPAFGTWLTLPGYWHARSLAASSPNLSWIIIDCEHGLVSLQPQSADSIAAIESITVPNGERVSSIVRIPATGVSTGTGWQIKYALDAGARGILVPMVAFRIPLYLFNTALTTLIAGIYCWKGG